MGVAKATLMFGPEVMLCRMVRLLGEAVDPIVVVAAADQPLPELPEGVRVVHDRRSERGPLEGLAVGLRAIESKADAAFVAACDLPLLKPAFVRRMVELAADADVAVPYVRGYDEPLAAVYRTNLVPQIEAMLAEDELRPRRLFDIVRTRRVTSDELCAADPILESLRNINTPTDLRSALIRAGLMEPRSSANRAGGE